MKAPPTPSFSSTPVWVHFISPFTSTRGNLGLNVMIMTIMLMPWYSESATKTRATFLMFASVSANDLLRWILWSSFNSFHHTYRKGFQKYKIYIIGTTEIHIKRGFDFCNFQKSKCPFASQIVYEFLHHSFCIVTIVIMYMINKLLGTCNNYLKYSWLNII